MCLLPLGNYPGQPIPRASLGFALGYLIEPRWGEDQPNGARLLQFSCVAGSDDLFEHDWAQGYGVKDDY
jgi:hypothetical protein